MTNLMTKGVRYLSLFLLVALTNSCQPTVTNNFDSSFVHSVHFWLKNPDSSEDRAAFETSLDRFLKASKYAKTSYIGIPPVATRSVVDDSFTYHLVVTFESAEAQEQYQKEEVHLKFIEESKDLWEKVIVYDSQGIN